jgi:hypothetical protein
LLVFAILAKIAAKNCAKKIRTTKKGFFSRKKKPFFYEFSAKQKFARNDRQYLFIPEQ